MSVVRPWEVERAFGVVVRQEVKVDDVVCRIPVTGWRLPCCFEEVIAGCSSRSGIGRNQVRVVDRRIRTAECRVHYEWKRRSNGAHIYNFAVMEIEHVSTNNRYLECVADGVQRVATFIDAVFEHVSNAGPVESETEVDVAVRRVGIAIAETGNPERIDFAHRK